MLSRLLKQLLGLRKSNAREGGAAAYRDRDDYGALQQRAQAAIAAGRLEEAREACAAMLALHPLDPAARLQAAIVEVRLGHHDEAMSALDALLADDPDQVQAYLWLGQAAVAAKQFERAAAALERAVALDPNDARARTSLAVILLRHLERPEDALMHSTAAYRADASLPLARLNHGLALQALGHHDEALTIYSTLFADAELGSVARMNAALVRLGRRDFLTAWDDYESRRELDEFAYAPPGVPDWQGESLQGKTVLAYWEQGLGDEIMFASCLPDLIAASDRCIVQCSPRLEHLFRRSLPRALVRGAEAAAPMPGGERADVRVAFGSLPRHFRRDVKSFPPHQGYLVADDAKREHWMARLDRDVGRNLKVGISWRGGLAQTRRSIRSLALQSLVSPLARPGLGFVSLQYGQCAEEIERLSASRGIAVQHYDEAIADYDQTAALVASLDLVVTVCTAVAHLAGALGKPVWVLVPPHAEWRYGNAGQDMPWYPSMTLLRAQKLRDWADVIGELNGILETCLEQHRRSS